jgi:hypothetical protein
VSFRLQGEEWEYRQYSGDCEPRSIVGNGPVVTWSLAGPKGLAPNAAVHRIKVSLGPGFCNDGKPQNPLARLVFRKWGRKLLMTVWLEPPSPGPHTCPGRVEPPLEVTLPRKTRLSRLFDGSTYPPTPAVAGEVAR